MPIHRIETAIEFDGPLEDAFMALASIMGALGLDPDDDMFEVQEGTTNDGTSVLFASMAPKPREGDEHDRTSN